MLMLYQSPPANAPLIVLASKENLGWLRDSPHVICDGNFKYQPEVPHRFMQLYTIHGFVHGEAVPLVYALLSDKTVVTYQTLFGAIQTGILQNFPDLGQMETATWHFD